MTPSSDLQSRVSGFLFTGRPYLNPDQYETRKRTDNIVIHCSATPPQMDIGVKEIREWHLKQGWLDVGYHFIIRRNGEIERGRPAGAIGSGVAGYNHNSLHIVLVGGVKAHNVEEAESNFTKEQWETLAFLVGNVKANLHPSAEVLGHRDFPGVQKECPSFDAKEWFKQSLADQERLNVVSDTTSQVQE